MKKRKTKKKWIRVIVSVLLMTVVTFVVAIAAEPGSEADPLITKSYIDSKVIPEIKNYIDQEVLKVKELIGNISPEGGGQSVFQIVNVSVGQSFVAGSGCEFILRMGKGTVFSSPKGGLVDTTAGQDIQTGNLPSNHLMISPINDGRGFTAQDNVIVMVKGNYQVK